MRRTWIGGALIMLAGVGSLIAGLGSAADALLEGGGWDLRGGMFLVAGVALIAWGRRVHKRAPLGVEGDEDDIE